MASPDVDLVSVVTPNVLHAAAAGVVHAANLNYGKVSAVRFIARLLRGGRIGEVRKFRGVNSRSAADQDWIAHRCWPIDCAFGFADLPR